MDMECSMAKDDKELQKDALSCEDIANGPDSRLYIGGAIKSRAVEDA